MELNESYIYRYYSSQRKIMSWSSLDRWPEPAPSLIVKNQPKILRQQLNQDGRGGSGFGGINSSRPGALPTTSNDLEACHVLGPSRKSHTCYYALRNTPVSLLVSFFFLHYKNMLEDRTL